MTCAEAEKEKNKKQKNKNKSKNNPTGFTREKTYSLKDN